MLMQNLGGQTKNIMVFSEVAYTSSFTKEVYIPEKVPGNSTDFSGSSVIPPLSYLESYYLK